MEGKMSWSGAYIRGKNAMMDTLFMLYLVSVCLDSDSVVFVTC